MLKIVLYEYLQGRTSPSRWHRDVSLHDALKWLGRGITPSRTAWYNFRDRADKFIHQLNDDLVSTLVQEGLVKTEDAAQDGTTIRSNASRHQTFNKTRLLKRRDQLKSAIEADSESEPLMKPPKWLPKTPSGRLQLLQRMDVAMEVLEQRLLDNAKKTKENQRLEKNIVVSLTDPLAPFARDKEKTFCFLYTTQMMVCRNSKITLGYTIAPENTDVGTIAPMIDKVQRLLGGSLKRVLVDAGYTSLLDLMDCSQRNVELIGPVGSNSFTASKQQGKKEQRFDKSKFKWLQDEQQYQCPQGHKMAYDSKEKIKRHCDRTITALRYRCPAEHCTACHVKSKCTTSPKGRTVRRLEREDLLEAQRAKMEDSEIRSLYRERGQIIERTYADAKQHRNARRFNGRGLARSRAETGLLVMAQNILSTARLRLLKEKQRNNVIQQE